jgi:hypothetical protein
VGSTLTLILALTALLASAVSLAVSAWVSLRPRPKSPEELWSHVRQQGLDLSELYDRVDHWQRRDRVRNVREGKVRAAEGTPAPDLAEFAHGANPYPPLSKEQLRELAGLGG